MALLVNGQPVDPNLLDAEFANVKSYFERLGNVSCCERDEEFRGYAKQNVVSRMLLSQHALASTPALPSAEVDAAFAALKEQHGGDVRFYSSIGATPEQDEWIKRDVESNLRVERFVEGLCGNLEPGEEELRAFYEKNVGAFMTAEEVRASHISKAPPRGEERASVYETFRTVRKQLLAGADFDELARQHSDRGQDLIDLGFFGKGQLPEEFEHVAFSMEVGEVSPVFSSPVGYHVVKVTDRKPARPKAFDEVREDVKRLYVEDRRQEKVRERVKTLEAGARIEEVADEPVESST